MKKSVILLIFAVLLSVHDLHAQSDDAALDAEARAVLAKTSVPQGQPYSMAIENWKSKKFFGFTQLDKGDTLSIPLARFYAREPSADARPQELLDAARSLMKLGYNADAEKYFARYLQTQDNDPTNHRWRGENAMFAGDYRACVDHIKKAFAKDRTSVWHDTYNFTLGTCYTELGDAAAAKKAYESLNDHLKKSTFYRLVQDDAFKCTGTADDNYAAAALSMSKGDSYAAFRDAFIATKCDSKHIPSFELLQKIAAAADERTDPLSDWANPLRLKVMRLKGQTIPPPFGLSDQEKAEFLRYFTAKFAEAQQERKYDWAIMYANEVVAGFPDRPEGYSMRARAVYNQEQFKDLKIAAWLDATQAIRLNPKDAKAFNVRGLIYYYLKKDTAAAVREYSNGIAAEPGDFRLYTNRGVAYYTAKDIKAAYSDFDRAAALAPTELSPFRNKALIAIELKDHKTAIPLLERMLELTPSAGQMNRWIQKNLVIAFDGIGDRTKANLYHQELLKCCFNDAETRSLEARDPALVAEWRALETLKEQNAQLELEIKQQAGEAEFMKIVDEDDLNKTSTDDSIKRRWETAEAIGQSRRAAIPSVLNSLDAAIEGRKKRIAKLEAVIKANKITAENLEKALKIIENIKTRNRNYEGQRARLQNELREPR